MPTHYLMVYENRSAIWAAVHFNAKTNYFQNLSYVSIWNDFFFYKICMDISCSKNLLIFFSIFRCEKLIN